MTALPTCPHCFAPVRGDGRPTCLCAAVDADDFDPLRIRPYVSLPDEDGGGGEGAGGDAGDTRTGRGDRLDDLPGVDAAVHLAAGTADGPSSAADTRPRAADPPFAADPLFLAASGEPLIPRVRRGSGPTSRTVSSAAEEPAALASTPASRRKRSLPAVLVAAGAAVAAAAVLISTDALSGDRQDRAAPPDRGTASPTAAFPTSGDTAPTRTGAPASPSAARSPSSGATGIGTPKATVKMYRTTAPPPPAPTQASGSVTASPSGPGPSAPPTGPIVLREGSSGPEVVELQGRLRQLALYPGADDGRYDTDVRASVSRYQQAYGVQGDPDGVYGAQTRASLESRTQEP
ncbi:peptidoglycan-binding domain-containing protein [Streptomyces inhibens]|uniref:peptidoglycan-binding domain-containing protein n=1 Tax=Streptomyces inhibens TaxID=2293571 RepID=UPI001EE6993E|nr:peptidoglycan-binding domain-containing protein [Streptomyces inhibens]UKY49964.1 peptidoglycan-binding protein [Streptomyces inhibens]